MLELIEKSLLILVQNKLSEQREYVYFRQIPFKKMKNLAFSYDRNNILTLESERFPDYSKIYIFSRSIQP